MSRSAPTGRVRKCTQGGTHLLANLLIVLFLACCGQTAETGGTQQGQTPVQTQVKGAGQATMPQPEGQQFQYAPDEVLVKFKPETSAKTIARIQAELKLETIRQFSSPNLFLLKITDGAPVEATINRLNNHEAVEYAEPNYGVKTTQ